MINSVPIEIIQLGLDHKDYEGIAKNIKRILNMSVNKWDSILKRAELELSEDIQKIACPLSRQMCYDREFFSEAGIPYSEGPPKQGCFTTSIADYLLRHKEKINLNNHI